MITGGTYLILNDISHISKIREPLCILNFDIVKSEEILKEFIKKNPKTDFWVTTNDFSKKFVLTASRLGIKNIVKYPIKTEIIEKYFETQTHENNLHKFSNYTPLRNSKLLIVDDNLLNIELLEEILSDLGVEITSCSNPYDAAEMIKTTHFNLFLLDILMPEMSGFELAEIIKTSTLNKNSSIIFISAVSGNENIMNGYSLGACSYIEKPFSPNIVKAQIYNMLKAQEDNIATDKIKENFVATLTHDLKSPINAEICALKHLISGQKGNSDRKDEILSELLNSAQYMKLITDKILSHYKQKNKGVILHKELTDIYPFILSCLEGIRFLSQEKGVNIRFYNNTENLQVYLDKIEIKRVINNLLSNAIEYSHKNGDIDIITDKTEDRFIFSIKDYGTGIDLSKHKNIFDEYMSLSKENKKTGFGLGLSICKEIIKAHKGEIKIESAPDKGTRITFWLPLI